MIALSTPVVNIYEDVYKYMIVKVTLQFRFTCEQHVGIRVLASFLRLSELQDVWH